VPEFRKVFLWGRTFRVDEDGEVQPAPGVDIDAQMAELEALGWEILDEDDDEATVTFVAEP
jgi:hypothetical protein